MDAVLPQGQGFMTNRGCGPTHTLRYTGRITTMVLSLNWILTLLPGLRHCQHMRY